MSEEGTIAARIRTGRRELRALLNPQRATHSSPKGVQRAQPKRPAGISARQWKIQRKFRKRWYTANLGWFGADEARRCGDKRIPVVGA